MSPKACRANRFEGGLAFPRRAPLRDLQHGGHRRLRLKPPLRQGRTLVLLGWPVRKFRRERAQQIHSSHRKLFRRHRAKAGIHGESRAKRLQGTLIELFIFPDHVHSRQGEKLAQFMGSQPIVIHIFVACPFCPFLIVELKKIDQADRCVIMREMIGRVDIVKQYPISLQYPLRFPQYGKHDGRGNVFQNGVRKMDIKRLLGEWQTRGIGGRQILQID